MFLMMATVVTLTYYYLSFWVNFSFYLDSGQVKCHGSCLPGNDFTTSHSPTTRARLSTSSTLRFTIWLWFFVVMSTYTLSYMMLLMVIIVLRCIYCYYDTSDFDSMPTTYCIGSNINILQWYDNNDINLSTYQLMFHLILVSSNIDYHDSCDNLFSPSSSPCVKSNLLIQHQQSMSFCSSVLFEETITMSFF